MTQKTIFATSVLLAAVCAQGAVTLTLTPGSLSDKLASVEEGEKEIVLKGSADATDFSALENLPAGVRILDMGGLELKAAKMAGSDSFGRSVYDEGELPGYIFSGSPLEEIRLPGNMKVVPEGAFANSSLKKVVLPEGVSLISARAFHGCSLLADINIPSGVVSIGEGAFAGCVGLEYMTLPAGVSLSGEGVFAGSGVRNLDVTAGKVYDAYSLAGMPELEEVSINPQSRMGEGVLFGNPSLTHISGEPYNLPELFAAGASSLGPDMTLKRAASISDYAYAGAGFKAVWLSSEVREIGTGTFRNCRNLTTIDANELGSDVPLVQDDSFEGVEVGKVALYVASDSYASWKSHPVWGEFDIRKGPSAVESVVAGSGIRIYPSGGSIVAESDTEGLNVRIYSTRGILLAEESGKGERLEIQAADSGERIVVVTAESGGSSVTATVMLR